MLRIRWGERMVTTKYRMDASDGNLHQYRSSIWRPAWRRTREPAIVSQGRRAGCLQSANPAVLSFAFTLAMLLAAMPLQTRAEDPVASAAAAPVATEGSDAASVLLALSAAEFAKMDAAALKVAVEDIGAGIRATSERSDVIRTEAWEIKSEARRANPKAKELQGEIEAIKARIEDLLNNLPEVKAKGEEYKAAEERLKSLGLLQVKFLKRLAELGIDGTAAADAAGVQQ